MRSDGHLERMIGLALRAGVLVSTVCLAAGLLIEIARPGTGGWLLSAGVLVLIATPALRVVIALVENLVLRDWVFAMLAALVLAELAASVAAALVFRRRL